MIYETSFGSSTTSITMAASVLRATAARAVELKDPSTIELAAAVVGADAWVLLTGHKLGDMGAASLGAQRVLAKILARAAGQPPSDSATPAIVDALVTKQILDIVERSIELVHSLQLESSTECLGRVSEDYMDCDDANLQSFGVVLSDAVLGDPSLA